MGGFGILPTSTFSFGGDFWLCALKIPSLLFGFVFHPEAEAASFMSWILHTFSRVAPKLFQ